MLRLIILTLVILTLAGMQQASAQEIPSEPGVPVVAPNPEADSTGTDSTAANAKDSLPGIPAETLPGYMPAEIMVTMAEPEDAGPLEVVPETPAAQEWVIFMEK